MKRYLIFALLATFTVSLTACSQAEPAPSIATPKPATAAPPETISRTQPVAAAELSSQVATQTPADQTPLGATVENGITLRGRIQWEGLASLFAQRGQPFQPKVDQVAALTLAGPRR